MTQHLALEHGTIAYEVHGQGPLVVLAHGMGDSRQAYRFLVPELVAAGYRVAATDLRGCGESSVGWPSYTRTDIAGDLIALVKHLGGPAVLVGHSISGGAVTIAAAEEPELVTCVVELAPFTRKQEYGLGDFKQARFRKGLVRLAGAAFLGSVGSWKRYLDVAYPGRKPADWEARQAQVETMMREEGRMKVLQKMGSNPPVDAGEALAQVQCPVLVIEGSEDPDWGSPQAEGEAVVARLKHGRLAMIEGAGHYPHAQYPAETLALMLPFLQAEARNSSIS
ncbi:alpha/beta fold hydrolase [Kineosporia babensis]|uniref:Alpha/beta hydrolase n=1 Tax=Kineosporia babensis TaxID=499548 RepID=A0A9X1SXV7_9ACTN|nr:alpha/beta hydrolase [Kineosporia babensis]MCD5316224.1 alpha/beta hydrolase [Kineosporia babensis]